MATRAANLADAADGRVAVVTWSGLLNGDDGSGAMIGRGPDRTVQIVGTFGAGGAVAIEGSNDGGTTWGPVKDAYGTDMSLTTSATRAIGCNPLLIRPRVTAGDGTTSLSAIIASVKRGF